VENKIQNLEDELKVLKNEVQAVLLDIKDTLISGGGLISAGGLSISYNKNSGGGTSSHGGGESAGRDILSDGSAGIPPTPQVIYSSPAAPAAQPSQGGFASGGLPNMPSAPPSFESPPQQGGPKLPSQDGISADMPSFDKNSESVDFDFKSSSPEQPVPSSKEEGPPFNDPMDWLTQDSSEQTSRVSHPGLGPSFFDQGLRSQSPKYPDAGFYIDPISYSHDWPARPFARQGHRNDEYSPYSEEAAISSEFGHQIPGRDEFSASDQMTQQQSENYTSSGQQVGNAKSLQSSSQMRNQTNINDENICDTVDLSLLAILTPWLSKAINTVGKRHLEKLIELYDISRDIPPRIKEALLMLLELYEVESSEARLPGEAVVSEGIGLLIELDGLLLRHYSGSFESVALSLLQERMTSKRKPRNRKAKHG